MKAETKSLRGFECRKEKLRPLGKAIKAWQRAIIAYCESAEGDDAPYFYNERANISLLAAGAWKSGMIALEEYPTKKRFKETAKQNSKGHRCDLFIWDDDRGFQIEAKQSWLPALLNENKLRNRVEKALSQACAAAEANTDSSSRLGCVFFAVWWPTASTYRRDSEAQIQSAIQTITSADGDIWAWVFPKETRELRDKSDSEPRYYPGVVLGLKAGKYSRFVE
jgi:hypothetical protein